jgi:hypothetical protein
MDVTESPDPSDGSAAGRVPEADLSRIRTISIATRPNKVEASQFATPPSRAADGSFRSFLRSLPHVLQADSLLAVVDAIVSAVERERAVVWMVGGHVVKTGIGPLLVELMDRGAVSHLSANGSAAIHDYEMARWGGTSEDVEAGLADGSFGMADETGRDMNLAFPELSLLLQSHLRGIPFTIHPAIGAEIIHQHPAADGAAIGDTGHRDFRRLAASLPALDDGGVVMNVGSAVIMPEVFLKALTVARNLHDGRPRGFAACDLDMLRHYRPRVNVVERPTRSGGGRGFQITGPHELLMPLITWAVAERLSG